MFVCFADLQVAVNGTIENSSSGGAVLSELIRACYNMPSPAHQAAWTLYEHALELGLTVPASAQAALWNLQTGVAHSFCS